MAVATIHTHPRGGEFSGSYPGATTGDIPNAIRRGLNTYVVVPSLTVKKYTVSNGLITEIATITPRVLSSEEKAAWQNYLGPYWEAHFDENGTCLRDGGPFSDCNPTQFPAWQ